MSTDSREVSRERETSPVRHGHTWSESGRASVPMWDSSDPDRAPPPLPLNPSTHSPTTKANTSAGIAAAARLIVEKARESTPISSYTKNSDGSPERSLIKGAHHRRMQSFQTGNVKDLRNYIDNRSPERSPERPASTDLGSFARKESIEEMSPFERSVTPTPASRDPLKDTPTLRPTARPPPRPLLGENTPPSATMLALQTMQVPDQPLSDVTNGPSTPSPSRQTSSLDFSSQLTNLTTIANNLQKEMAQLSRRSKDNATDLISLKEATSQRDEDIRKSLRDLSSNFHNVQGLLGPPPASGRATSGYSSIFDNGLLSSPPSASKSYGVPRAASAPSFLEDGHIGSPSPYSVEGAASVAMLEKIIREMVTKEGQERLQGSLSELLEKSRKENSEAAKRVEQLSEFIKEKSQSQALVPFSKDGPPILDLNFDSPGLNSRTRDADGKEAKMIGVDEELMKMLQRIKDSIAHAGGTTSEVKGLVRDLRGEVLGMGRDLGRKLDQVGQTQPGNADRSIGDAQGAENAAEVQRIVEDGINELKEQLSGILRERADGSDDALKQLATRSAPDEDGIFAVVKHALAEHGAGLAKRDLETETSDLDREGILDAVKEGLKDFEPNIELQQFGLERDEILAVLKEGLDDYQSNRPEAAPAVIDKGEIYEVMQEAMKDFRAPALPHEHIAQMKEEILDNLRQALEEHRSIASDQPIDHEATRSAVTEAVREGLANHGPAAPRELEISREDLFDAVKASLDGSTIPFGGFGEQVLSQMQDLISEMRIEFKQYSAANGRDTEQVLDAVKDGLESLRTEIESYVDRAQDVTGKDEIVETVKGGLEQLRSDVLSYAAQDPAARASTDKGEMLEYIRSEFEHLHQAINERDGGATRDLGEEEHKALDSAGIILAMKAGLDELKGHVGASRGLDDEGPSEEMFEAMKEELEQLKTTMLNAHAHDKNELVETIQDSMGALHAKLNGSEMSMLSAGAGGATEEIIREMRLELTQLKETVHAIVIDGDREAIVLGVRQAVDDLRTQLSADQSDASAEALGAIREELERLKEQINGGLAASSDGSRSIIDDDTLSTLKSQLDDIKENAGPGLNDEMLEAIRGEFENLRNSFAASVVPGGHHEEVLDAVRLGLDDLRSHMDRKLDTPERGTSQHSELLDVINEGLENLRTDVVKTLDKPLDMTVNYEILETLKAGLADLRLDMDKLKTGRTLMTPEGNQVVLAENNGILEAREIPREAPAPGTSTSTSHSKEDIDRMEVLLTQLQIKIEAMDATVQDMSSSHSARPAGGTAMRDDIISLEGMLRELQDSVASISENRDERSRDGAATKDDTDAIETLLRNTKAHLEELNLPDGANAVTKDHLDSVEAVVRVTNDAIDVITDKLETSVATKADVAVVEVLASDVKTALDDMSQKLESRETPETMTKADLDVLGIICTEIKNKVNDMEPPDPESLPSRSDIEQLEGLINDFRESHDKMKEGYENDIAVTAKAFDDRKQDFEETIREFGEVKAALAEVKEEVISKISESDCGIDALGETLKGLEEKTNNDTIGSDVRELVEKVTEEFRVAHESLSDIRGDHQQAAESSLEKQAEHRSALEGLINEKLETYFDGLMSKYDDAQQAAQEHVRAMEEKADAQEELMSSTKAMADDLKLSIDTLGTTLTSFCANFPDTVERMAEESKTVFNKVDDTYNKLDETQEGLRSEHSATRDEITKLLTAVNFVQSDMTEHNPRFLVALQEVQALIGQHYDHSRKAFDVAADHAQAVKDLQEQVRGLGTQNDDLRNNVIPGLSLPAPTETSERSAPVEFDDSALHEKLDKLMGQAREVPDASLQIERLDQIHEKVMATAAEVSAFVSQQTKQIAESRDQQEREAEELTLLLERRQMKKDEIEDDIIVLNEEKDSLARDVEALKAEKEALTTQKSRLNAEVSSLETAMHIRRSELHEMDRKAETLERRIMEGVMNQSRMLLLAKSTKSASSVTSRKATNKPSQGRDLRIPSNASAASAQTITSSVPSLKPNHSLALRSRGMAPRAANSAERRIMSLNQINHNVPTGSSAFLSQAPSLISNSSNGGGPGGMKRSHSVKTHTALRKPSWTVPAGGSGNDKENEVLHEEDSFEDDVDDGASYQSRSRSSRALDHDEDEEDMVSEAGTERRRTSHLTYSTDNGEAFSPYDEHAPSESGRASYLSYATSGGDRTSGSYFTNSELSRASLGSSAGGVVGSMPSAIDEEDEEGEEENDGGEVYEEAEEAAASHRQRGEQSLLAYEPTDGQFGMDVVRHQYGGSSNGGKGGPFYYPPSDSGLGTDLPTVALGGPHGSLMDEKDYFHN